MNKQEVIEKIKKEKSPFNSWEDLNRNNALDVALDIVEKLDEEAKPLVPQFVADWYEKSKDYFESNLYNLCVDFHKRELPDDLHGWFTKNKNKPIETLVKMKLFGYEIEKEKLYLASFRDTNQYLGWNETLGEWFMSCSPFTSGVEQTQETWEGVGIWNNPAFEIKKAEE